MAGPDDLLNPPDPQDTSMDAFTADFGPTVDVDEFNPPPPPPQRQAPTVAPPGDVQISIKAPRQPAAAPQAPKVPPNDPLAWLSGATSGTLRFQRKPDHLVNGKGIALRGKHKGKYVGVGDCGMTEVMAPEEVRAHIIENWGGGTYVIEHLDSKGNKTGVHPPLKIPGDPLPSDGVSDDEDEDDDGDPLAFFETAQTQQPTQNQYGPYGPPLPYYQVPQHHPQNPMFIPPYVEQNIVNERESLKTEAEKEREERRKVEAQLIAAQNEKDRERERSERQREQDRLEAQLAAMREAMKQPQDSGMSTMLQMMIKQQEAAQQRYENEARERRDREEREARERREKEDKNAKEQADRERREAAERRERDEKAEKERREDRRVQQELAAAQAKQSQDFMQLVLGQKMDPLKLFEVMNGGKNQSNPLAAIDTAFAVVERAQAMAGGGGGEGDSDEEGGVTGAFKAGAKILRPIAEAWAASMRQQQQVPPGYVRVPVQQVRPQQPQIPQQPGQQPAPPPQASPPPPPTGQPGQDQMVFHIAKIAGIAGRGFAQKRDPEILAAAMLGAAEMAGLTSYMESFSEADPTMIQQQLQAAANIGLPHEAQQQIESFLAIYNQPGGREWIKELLEILHGGADSEPDDEDDEDEDDDSDDEDEVEEGKGA